MTCLYCGKKLGFFSRYKDTPFCSEEHLRTHQEELERALMERLGSKSVAPNKSLSDLASPDPEAAKSAAETTAPYVSAETTLSPAPKQTQKELKQEARQAAKKESRQESSPSPKQAKASAPMEAPPLAAEAPAPLHEDYLFLLPNPVAALDIENPLIPPASFAIIVQADCCTPSSPASALDLNLPLEATEFELDAQSLLNCIAFGDPAQPAPFDEEGFGEPWVELPVDTDTNFELQADFIVSDEQLPLEYEAAYSAIAHTPMGHRNEIEARTRLRFPYAASQVTSTWNVLPCTEESFAFTIADDWDAIIPETSPAFQLHAAFATPAKIVPFVDVPLTLRSFTRLNLYEAGPEDFGESLTVFAQALADSAGLLADCSASSWDAAVALPGPPTSRNFRPRWQPNRSADRVPPVPFPSLFQFGPVLPPRPESSAG